MNTFFASNEIIFTNDEFYISYLQERNEFGKACDEFCAMLGRPAPQHERPETALCVRKPGHNDLGSTDFFILYDDHREAYRKLAPDLNACIVYFLSHLDQIGCSSDMPEVVQQ